PGKGGRVTGIPRSANHRRDQHPFHHSKRPREIADSITQPGRLRYGSQVASITLKDLPEDLHGQLKLEAQANFRSLAQEALARLQRSFEIDAAIRSKRDQ